MPEIKLIATDLDGTLIGSANEFPLYTSFRNRLADMRRRTHVVWVPCTGRSWRSFQAFFAPMRLMGLSPDHVIVHHAYIYGLSRFGFLTHLFWNLHIKYQLWTNRLYQREAISEWHRMITAGALGVHTVVKEEDRLRLRFNTEEAAEVAAGILRQKAASYRHLRVFQYRLEVDVKQVPFTKGLAVSELARHLGVPRENILTIGDGHNDISMLDPDVAGMIGCPANAEPEVMAVVRQRGGHIASKPSLSGVMEIIEAYLEGRVVSELPANWVDPVDLINPSKDRNHHDREGFSMPWRKVFLGIVSLYTAMVVFASFGMIPGVNVLMAPLTLLARWSGAAWDWLYARGL